MRAFIGIGCNGNWVTELCPRVILEIFFYYGSGKLQVCTFLPSIGNFLSVSKGGLQKGRVQTL